MELINLQNTPTPKTIETRGVKFKSGDVTLRGTLYSPEHTYWAATKREADRLSAVVVTGAWTTVQEQMAGTYAREMALRGMYALTFDFTGWGRSGGDRRYVEDPEVKTADIQAAFAFMEGHLGHIIKNFYGLGICASSGYMADAVVDISKVAKLALIAPWLHDWEMAADIYGGHRAVNKLISSSVAAEIKGNPKILPAASMVDESAPMFQTPYYTEEHRGLIPEYDNKFSILSWEPWLNYSAFFSAKELGKPMLVVGSDGMALPAGVDVYEHKSMDPFHRVWLADDVTQFDFYDRKDIVMAASDAVAEFFLS